MLLLLFLLKRCAVVHSQPRTDAAALARRRHCNCSASVVRNQSSVVRLMLTAITAVIWSSRGTLKPTTVRTDAAAGVGGIVLPVQRKQFAAIVGITDSATDQRASPAAVVRCT